MQPLYDKDFRLWAIEQARLVREGRWDELDRENVVEELASIARDEQREAEDLVCWILKQLLLWSARPDRRCGRWASRILERRFRLKNHVRTSPSIDTAGAISTWWPVARDWTVVKARLSGNPFPAECPYSIEQILDTEFWPD